MATAKHLTPHFQAERWPRRKSLGPLGSARLTCPFTHQQHSRDGRSELATAEIRSPWRVGSVT